MKADRTPRSTVEARRRAAGGSGPVAPVTVGADGDSDLRPRVAGMDVGKIARRISTELEGIAAQLRRQDGPPAPEHPGGDFFDAAQVVEHREREHFNTGRLADRARRLAAALERVRAGAYGICVECGEAIPRARLLAIPDANACVQCQARLEHAQATTEAGAASLESAWKPSRRRARESAPR
jgi:RNA polymerase-binding transcription factor